MKTRLNRLSVRRQFAEAAVNLAKRRTWYADAATTPAAPATGTPDATPAPTTTTITAATTPVVPTTTVATPATQTTPPATPPANEGDKGMVPQEKVNQLMGDAKREAREKALVEFAKEFNFDSVDALRGALTAKKDATAGEESELTKLTQRIAALETERDAAKEAASKANAERLLTQRDTAIKDALTDPKVRCNNPSKVIALVSAMTPDVLKATITADGVIDAAAIQALVETAKKDHKEYFVGGGPGSPSVKGGVPPASPSTDTARNDSFRAARRNI